MQQSRLWYAGLRLCAVVVLIALAFVLACKSSSPARAQVTTSSPESSIAQTLSSDGQAWLQAVPASGGMPEGLELRGDATTLNPGTYQGMVRMHGELWRAVARESLPAGAEVRVTRVEGLTMHVSPVEKRATSIPGAPAAPHPQS